MKASTESSCSLLLTARIIFLGLMTGDNTPSRKIRSRSNQGKRKPEPLSEAAWGQPEIWGAMSGDRGGLSRFRWTQTGYGRMQRIAQRPVAAIRNTKRTAFTRGQIAVEVWVKSGSSNRLDFLNAWQEYGYWKSSAMAKIGRK